MSLQHFYLESQVLAEEADEVFALMLSPDDEKHARVLRMGPGEHIAVVDAALDYFECEIESHGPEGMRVRIASHLGAPARRPRVTLLQGLAKGDKMDEVIRHATELGVSSFVPLECSRSVMRIDPRKAPKKLERWRAVAKSAAMQSGQLAIPEVHEPQKPSAAAARLRDYTAVCVCWEEAPQSQKLSDAIAAGLSAQEIGPEDARIAVVVGPEGGLTEEEVASFLGSCPNAALVSLGPSILRTETAGVVAPALALYELGQLGG